MTYEPPPNGQTLATYALAIGLILYAIARIVGAL